MNLLKDLYHAIRENQDARTGLVSTIVDCTGMQCSKKLPDPVKSVQTRHNFARPA